MPLFSLLATWTTPPRRPRRLSKLSSHHASSPPRCPRRLTRSRRPRSSRPIKYLSVSEIIPPQLTSLSIVNSASASLLLRFADPPTATLTPSSSVRVMPPPSHSEDYAPFATSLRLYHHSSLFLFLWKSRKQQTLSARATREG
ncbi:hypothetical protein ACFX12_025299 [Malus domestica]